MNKKQVGLDFSKATLNEDRARLLVNHAQINKQRQEVAVLTSNSIKKNLLSGKIKAYAKFLRGEINLETIYNLCK